MHRNKSILNWVNWCVFTKNASVRYLNAFMVKYCLQITFILALVFLFNWSVLAQPCTGGTPSTNVNLTGNKDSVWTSGSITRGGSCCSDNNCVEFNVTIDPNSNGIKLEMISGAIPSGALNYTIGCGTPQTFGSAVCLSGVGPHRITFCKPGGNANVYRITAIPKPSVAGSLVSSVSCGVYLKSSGLVVNSGLTWQSVPNNGSHNGFLSCASNCDSVRIIPTSVTFPINLKYRVCGSVIGGCNNSTDCDTATVTVVDNPKVVIPDSVKICYGQANTIVSSSISGGLLPYSYTWSGGGNASSKTIGIGSHVLSATDALGCFVTKDTTVVTTFSGPFLANAGTDSTMCNSQNVLQLKGQIQNANGGIWTGGSGVFSPSNTSLTATYTPTQSEKSQGSLKLYLNTTNIYGCANIQDTVQFNFLSLPVPVISGDTIPCSLNIKSYITPAVAGNSYLWSVTGGNIIGGQNTNTFTVKWGSAGNGLVSIKQTSSQGCENTVSQNITISPLPTGATLYHY